MASNQITPKVRQFVQERIRSIAQLELLLLLRTSSANAFTAGRLSELMRVDPKWTATELQLMCEDGLVSKSGDAEPRWVYQTANAELEQIVAEVAQAHLLQRTTVIELIYSPATAAARAFADAFRLRREPRHG